MTPPSTPHVLVIGAGIGGLTSAALLLKAGFRVTVLEAHIYPGGSAGTFFHQGYRFDAGATLAGGFFEGGPHWVIEKELEIRFPTQRADPAWVTHLGGKQISQWQDPQQWQEEILGHFPQSAPFWKKQVSLAESSWRLSAGYFPYPPQTKRELLALSAAGLSNPRLITALPYLFAKVTDLLPKKDLGLLKTFLDAQLIISAQTTAQHTNALYGSAALDLPRRGVVYISGGMGTIAKQLVQWISDHGGTVFFRRQVTQLLLKNKRVIAVETNKGERFEADYFIGNLTPLGLEKIINPQVFAEKNFSEHTKSAWGAFMLYLGVDQTALPPGFATHHQVILNPEKPMGEGNSVFISISHPGDATRAPLGALAVTCSTHTRVQPWLTWAKDDPEVYASKKAEYTQRILHALESILPDIRQHITLNLPATPKSFQVFTRRPLGLVGGFPQESLFKVRGPRTPFANFWLVGDSIFPGQSTAAVTIGAQRVVKLVKDSLK